MLCLILRFCVFALISDGIGAKTFTNKNNNVCPTVNDYISMKWNPKCWHDPDADVRYNVTQLITNHGYRSETHEVTTEDGYILTMFRIINEKLKDADKQPVFLQHGLSGSCTGFLGLGNKSLAYLLSDAGYDVWLGNSRGNVYSTKHLKYSSKTDYRYWNFSFHEMGVYDLPAALEYVKRKSDDKKLIYLGVSMGTTMAMVYSSVFPRKAADTVKLFVFFCPVMASARGEHINYSVLGPTVKHLVQVLPKGTLDFLTNKFSPHHSQLELPFLPLYADIQIVGAVLRLFDALEFNHIAPETLTKIIRQNPGGGSIKTYIHIFNSVRALRMYDYGKRKNMQIYGTDPPPKYNLSKFEVPIYTYYSDGDKIAAPEDVFLMLETIPDRVKVGVHKIAYEKFTHMEYLYSPYAKTLLYDHLIEMLANKLVK